MKRLIIALTAAATLLAGCGTPDTPAGRVSEELRDEYGIRVTAEQVGDAAPWVCIKDERRVPWDTMKRQIRDEITSLNDEEASLVLNKIRARICQEARKGY